MLSSVSPTQAPFEQLAVGQSDTKDGSIENVPQTSTTINVLENNSFSNPETILIIILIVLVVNTLLCLVLIYVIKKKRTSDNSVKNIGKDAKSDDAKNDVIGNGGPGLPKIFEPGNEGLEGVGGNGQIEGQTFEGNNNEVILDDEAHDVNVDNLYYTTNTNTDYGTRNIVVTATTRTWRDQGDV